MKKWYKEDIEWEIKVVSYLRGDSPVNYCRNGEEVGDLYTCTYGCPVNSSGHGICSKVMLLMFPIMEAVRSGGDLKMIGGQSSLYKEVVCPDGCVLFSMKAIKTGDKNFFEQINSNL